MLARLRTRLNKLRNRRKWKIILKNLSSVYNKYSHFTMIPKNLYIDNLLLCRKVKDEPGDVVECGVWRGGMIAGIAEMLGNSKNYYLFDSFEGLPIAKDIDGINAINWQNDTQNPNYYDNCKAEIDFAHKAMQLSNVKYECVKGWFDQTVPNYDSIKVISILRLDGDWYDSTMICLIHLFPKVVKGGIIIIDDYYAWDGCSKAVHDYLSKTQSRSRIATPKADIYNPYLTTLINDLNNILKAVLIEILPLLIRLRFSSASFNWEFFNVISSGW